MRPGHPRPYASHIPLYLVGYNGVPGRSVRASGFPYSNLYRPGQRVVTQINRYHGAPVIPGISLMIGILQLGLEAGVMPHFILPSRNNIFLGVNINGLGNRSEWRYTRHTGPQSGAPLHSVP